MKVLSEVIRISNDH
jgi:uncharacterized protein (DUF885 family)